MQKLPKKAVIGIGTLIVFLSVIIVAGISAGTILRTAGVLEQKSRAVGSDVRESITSYIEVNSIFGHANITGSYVTKLEIYGNLQLSSKKTIPELLSINLEPFNLIYSYDSNHTFYNKPSSFNFCNSTLAMLDIDQDKNEDRIAIINDSLIWYYNDSDYVKIVDWERKTYDHTFNLEKEGVALANISLSGFSTSATCTDGVNITVIPFNSFGHFTIKFFKNSSVINPGDSLKFILFVPNLYEDKDYSISFINKRSIISTYSFTIPMIFQPYVQLK